MVPGRVSGRGHNGLARTLPTDADPRRDWPPPVPCASLTAPVADRIIARWEPPMSPKVATILVSLLLALNLLVMALNFTSSSSAAVAGLRAHQLENHPDFVRAVRSIVQKCRVNVDLATVFCSQGR
jgi:hypothetical protein